MGILEITILFVVIAVLLGIILIYNNCISARNKVSQSKSTIDVYLNQRFDLIPNLVQCVKGYQKHEENILKTISELRSIYNETKNLDTAKNLINKMNVVVSIAEANPSLESNEQFLFLQKNLVKIESQLQAARRIYKGDVTLYNTTIQTFPNNIIANLFKMTPKELFTIEEYKAQTMEVKL